MVPEQIEIPVDIYDSATEFVVVMPLGGVEKSSVQLTLEQTQLTISGFRKKPTLKEILLPVAEECYRGSFTKNVELPANSYFNKIHSELTPDNILLVIVPKVIIPEKIMVHIQ